MIPATWLLLSLACSAPTPTPAPAQTGQAVPTAAVERPPSFVIIDIDSLRADRLHARRDGELVAPTIAALADRGVRFDHAVSQSGWTIPALVSLLTGRPPLLHDPRRFGPSQWPYLEWFEAGSVGFPELLHEQGYRTIAYFANTAAGQYHASLRGFDQIDVASEGSRGHPLSADPMAWLDWGEGPFMMLFHEVDLHGPESIAAWEELHQFVSDHPDCQRLPMREIVATLGPSLGVEGAIDHAEGHYDAGLRVYDARVASILAGLETRGLLDETVIILTSNHGEDFHEHGMVHHVAMWDSILRIPLVWLDPAVPAPGAVREELVQTVDIPSTILARAGIQQPAGMSGRSLLPLLGLAEGSWEDLEVYSASNLQQLALRTRTHKLMLEQLPPKLDSAGLQGPRTMGYQLFDLGEDPTEQDDIFVQEPTLGLAMVERLMSWRDERLAATPQDAPSAEAAQHLRQQLQERGYWDAAAPGVPEPRQP
jgi:arylsulfatase A-like enzyme